MLPRLGRTTMEENDKCAEKSAQDLAGVSPLFFFLHVVPCTSSLPPAFVLVRSTKNEAFEEGEVLSLFPPPPPHLFRRQIRRLKVLNMTWNHILIIRYPLSKLNAGLKIDFRETPQVTVRGFEMLFSTIHFCYFSDALRFNPFTAKVLHGLL